jgi:hypothetical protein
MVIQGAKCVQLGSDTINYGAGDYLLTSLDLPVAWRVVEASPQVPHFCITMAISTDKVLDLIGRTELGGCSQPAKGQRGIIVNVATPELLDAAVRLMRLLDSPNDIPAMASLIEQEILYRILTGPAGAQLVNIAVSDSHGNRIARAIAWLRAHFASPLRIDELAEHAGMSVLPSPLQVDYGHDTGPVPEAAQAARGAAFDAGRRAGCRQCRSSGRLSEPVAVQS